MAKAGSSGESAPCDNQGPSWGFDKGGQICRRQAWASCPGVSDDPTA